MHKKRKIHLSFVFKLIFSFSIIAFILIQKTSIKDIFQVLKDANFFLIGFSFSLHALGLLISAIRWKILIHAQGNIVPLGYLTQSYLVGTFFNNFLPTRIGGDVVRIWDGSRYSESLIKSSAIVLVERLTGIIVLFFFAIAASLFRIEMAQKIPVIWVSLLLGIFGLTLIIGFLTPLSSRMIRKLPDSGFLVKAKQKILDFREAILVYRTKQASFLKALFWALFLQINVVFHYFLIGKALGLRIPLIDYFIFIPIVLLIQLIPITVNGLGLREGSYIEIFNFYNISPNVAFSFSIIDIAFMLIIGIIGGIIYILRK